MIEARHAMLTAKIPVTMGTDDEAHANEISPLHSDNSSFHVSLLAQQFFLQLDKEYLRQIRYVPRRYDGS